MFNILHYIMILLYRLHDWFTELRTKERQPLTETCHRWPVNWSGRWCFEKKCCILSKGLRTLIIQYATSQARRLCWINQKIWIYCWMPMRKSYLSYGIVAFQAVFRKVSIAHWFFEMLQGVRLRSTLVEKSFPCYAM